MSSRTSLACAISDLARGRRPARRDRDDAERDEDPERRQGCVADPRANLHRRVRRPSVEERLHRPAVVGIVNVTPDSFSDGGVHLDPDAAASAARRMLADGAQLVDVGGESTRPGSEGVSLDEELRRVVPVLERLEGLPLSIDTAKAEVARRALALGAELVNDVTALRGDPELAGVVADAGAYLCLMHMRGEPRTMQDDPRYDDVASEVAAFLEGRLAFAVARGHPRGARLPRPRDRLRQDAGAELRARAAPRRPARARPAGARRPLAQELARQALRRRGAHGQPRRLARRRGRRVRARRVDLPRPRRPRARRGAGRRGGGRSAGMKIELVGIELHGHHGALEEERERGQTVPLRRRARGRRAGPLRPDRGRRRLPRRRRLRARGLRRAARTTCSRRSQARSPTSCRRASRSSGVYVRVRKPDVVLDPPVEYAAVVATRP